MVRDLFIFILFLLLFFEKQWEKKKKKGFSTHPSSPSSGRHKPYLVFIQSLYLTYGYVSMYVNQGKIINFGKRVKFKISFWKKTVLVIFFLFLYKS